MRKNWGGVLVLGAFFFLAPGFMPARVLGMEGTRPHGSDYLTFAEELRTQGALGFYGQTEDMLRAGKFEGAFTRFLYLRANIRGQAMYTGLAASVNQRLQFLREQMHLGEEALGYDHRDTYTKRRRAKPACPPPEKKTAKKEAGPEEKPPEMIIPAPAPEDKETPPLTEGAKTPAQETKPAGEEAQKPGEDAQKPGTGTQPAPAAPPSFWEKFKRKIRFW